ncbi:hypothetical protein BCIN_16g02070 [Botrytis cinerea B05.10]|uniref:Uncharacterized protein n=1 Tax=Botryotinia fuckeliana (strain B05.10) TaxID=332648 RepID=A0A384K6I7_BOTFB|nr:hypothetical protein BCIN_16g02070 [Botrytis cinerea B05.10]ATZ58419.1 hypothetical protein BCIN_16g02070 [Botrytis cinerea B05.10]
MQDTSILRNQSSPDFSRVSSDKLIPFAQTPEFSIWCRIETVNILVTHYLHDLPYIELYLLVDIPRSVRRQIETLQGPNHLITIHANTAVSIIHISHAHTAASTALPAIHDLTGITFAGFANHNLPHYIAILL